jgi:hypothetical protein
MESRSRPEGPPGGAAALRELTPEEVAEGQRGIKDKELTATQVQALVRIMDASKMKWHSLKWNKESYEGKLKEENEFLYYNFPSLFQMHAEDRLDSTFFEMLALKRKIERGEMTTEQASGAIGQRLFNRFVPAHLGGTPAPTGPTLSYEDYYRQQ